MASADFCFFTMPHLRTLRLSFTPSPSPMRPSSPNARPYSVCSSTPCQHHRDRGTSSLQARAHRQHHHDLTLRNQYAHIVPAHCCSHPLSRHTNGHSIGYAMLTHQAETGQPTAVESHAFSECSARRDDALDPGAPALQFTPPSWASCWQPGLWPHTPSAPRRTSRLLLPESPRRPHGQASCDPRGLPPCPKHKGTQSQSSSA